MIERLALYNCACRDVWDVISIRLGCHVSVPARYDETVAVVGLVVFGP